MSPEELGATAGIAFAVACAMEPWSRFVHAHLWHGPLYGLHRTHHRHPSAGSGGLEGNDLFSAAHAGVAALALYLGLESLDHSGAVVATGLGGGLCGYGLAYIMVHDGFVHGRLPVGFLGRWRFFRRVRAAHEIHHRHGGLPFGLFLGPWELRRSKTERRCRQPDPRS
ncbi:MAG: beta-carotene hydroxylase [Myxococcota bacterium]